MISRLISLYQGYQITYLLLTNDYAALPFFLSPPLLLLSLSHFSSFSSSFPALPLLFSNFSSTSLLSLPILASLPLSRLPNSLRRRRGCGMGMLPVLQRSGERRLLCSRGNRVLLKILDSSGCAIWLNLCESFLLFYRNIP